MLYDFMRLWFGAKKYFHQISLESPHTGTVNKRQNGKMVYILEMVHNREQFA